MRVSRSGDHNFELNPSRNDEVVVKLANGNTLRSGSSSHDFTSGEYVSLCGPDGDEMLYWDSDEWRCDPVLVMGAIMNTAAGIVTIETEEND